MGALSPILRSVEGGQVSFWCPGCSESHVVRVDPAHGSAWGYNGNPDAPTFTPSIKVSHRHWTPPVTHENMDEWRRAPWVQTPVEEICHSFVKDGRIEFLTDCTHALAGQTVDLPAWNEPDSSTGDAQ